MHFINVFTAQSQSSVKQRGIDKFKPHNEPPQALNRSYIKRTTPCDAPTRMYTKTQAGLNIRLSINLYSTNAVELLLALHCSLCWPNSENVAPFWYSVVVLCNLHIYNVYVTRIYTRIYARIFSSRPKTSIYWRISSGVYYTRIYAYDISVEGSGTP
jgi:hypothetical protein